jgi:serine/threonine-protein kinase RsbW
MSSLETIAERGQLAAVTEFVRKAAREAAFNDDDLLAVDLIVEEIFLNIAMHGYKDEPAGRVEIHCASPEAGVMTIQFKDWAEEFNPLAANNGPASGIPLSQRTIGGLGLVVVKNVAESITYQRIDDTNELSVRIVSGAGGHPAAGLETPLFG